MTVAEVVKHAREEFHMSKETLANLVGRSVAWITELETGNTRGCPHEATMQRLRDVLRLDKHAFDEAPTPSFPSLLQPLKTDSRELRAIADSMLEDLIYQQRKTLFYAIWESAQNNVGMSAETAWKRYESIECDSEPG